MDNQRSGFISESLELTLAAIDLQLLPKLERSEKKARFLASSRLQSNHLTSDCGTPNAGDAVAFSHPQSTYCSLSCTISSQMVGQWECFIGS